MKPLAIQRKNFNTDAILKKIYPLVEKALDSRLAQWKLCMSRFMQKRSEMLFDIAPCDRIVYNDSDRKDLFDSLNIMVDDVKKGLHDTYYWNIELFKPSHAKDPLSVVALCIVRYFMLKKDEKNLTLAMIYQAFSGKYYPSIHAGSFPLVAPAKYRHIMEYVVNNKLTNKFEIKATGSVIGAIKTTNTTWINSYKDMIKRFDDEDVTYVMQQIHNRIKSFMKNIAALYYEAYENKEFITYDKDSLPEEENSSTAYHLTDNDSFKLQRYVENTMTRINSSQVDYKTCKMCADANVKTEEIRSIFEAIFNNKENIDKVREYVTNMITTYLVQSENKDVATLSFFKFATAPKPNSKDELVVRMKEIIEDLLDSNSVSYRKRRHRLPTKASYYKAFSTYFAISIINANK